MKNFSQTALRVTALALLLGSTVLAAPSFAAPVATSQAPAFVVAQADDSSMTTTTTTTKKTKMKKGMQHGPMTPADMKAMVEQRISTLHDKLAITPDQEEAWSGVAQAMRDSEANTSNLIMQRHQSAGSLSAVDDLKSYQAIAQAHADGLSKVIDAFSSLYDSMSDDQKKNADAVFNTFEGHDGGKPMMKK